jgi:hypothetical protein
MTDAPQAIEWSTSQWFNADGPLTLAGLRGKVVMLHAFQMLCPGCVSHGVPQAERVHHLFSRDDVAVVGLHTVFEHHAAMTPVALEAFLHEYRITHPVGVDAAVANEAIPQTMRAYAMQGTPSLILIDRAGRMRLHEFGRMDDLRLGSLLGRLVTESVASAETAQASNEHSRQVPAGCDDSGCGLPVRPRAHR